MVKKLLLICFVVFVFGCGSEKIQDKTPVDDQVQLEPDTEPVPDPEPETELNAMMEKKCAKTYGSIDLDCSNF